MNDSVVAQEATLEQRLAFETLLSDLSSRFVNIEPAAVDHQIDDALSQICECLGLDIAALWQLSPEEPGVFRMTNIFRRVDGSPIPEDFDAREYNPWALGEVFDGKVVALRSIEEAPAEATTDLATWRYFDIKSVFLFPLSTGGKAPFGAMSYHAIRDESSWPDEIVQRLQLVTQIFANAIVRKRVDAALRESRGAAEAGGRIGRHRHVDARRRAQPVLGHRQGA